jgi:hypothetical protein
MKGSNLSTVAVLRSAKGTLRSASAILPSGKGNVRPTFADLRAPADNLRVAKGSGSSVTDLWVEVLRFTVDDREETAGGKEKPADDKQK